MANSDALLFETWVRQHQAFLYRAAWALTGERAAAQDLVQETFALAWRARQQLQNVDAVQGWLYRILTREAWRQGAAHRHWDSLDDAAAIVEHISPDERIDLVRALQRIAPIHREILVLYYLTETDYTQLATALDIPLGTVMSRLNRARDALRQALGHTTEKHGRSRGKQPL